MDENPYRAPNASNEKPERGSGAIRIIKKILIGLGVVFGLLIVLIIWGAYSTSNTYGKFENRAEPFIENFLAEQDPWDYKKARPYLSDAWLESTTDEDGVKLFGYFKKLGVLTSIDSIAWQGCLNHKSTSGAVERCNYDVMASYENGKAQLYFGLSIESEELKLMQLRINSDVFMQP
ncbi:hypothetical protein [Amphritea pacifica]|uniref:hypothetical protein n=1 Tax=Amphritea pacifica TaxID=2811233 RepID=UPI00196592A2|nr:hypothetical protein [Amphritea pacifica]MBN1008819.1 hypothetical protein [Amphritea pacifica]